MFTNGTMIDIPSEDNDYQSELHFPNVSMSDFGNYTVSARNEIGQSVDVMFHLDAEGRYFV